jgi:FlaA1/EpsC-like NDP-sugar epimerase
MPRTETPDTLADRLLASLPKLRNRHFLLLDLIALALIPAAALLLRLDRLSDFQLLLPDLLTYTLLGLFVRTAIFVPFGLYSRYWRYATVGEMWVIAVANFTATACLCALFFALRDFGSWGILPRSLPLLDGLLGFFAIASIRFSVRLAERSLRQRPCSDGRRVLVVGAGNVGQHIVKEMLDNPNLGMQPVAFLDDDAAKQGVRISDLPVLGRLDELARVVADKKIAEVVIAMPTAPGKTIRGLLEQCDQAEVSAKTVPAMSAILEGAVNVNRLRKVQIEDLLRRDSIRTDIAAVKELIRGRRVLITGGGGSIGSELCRQVFHCGPSELVLLGHGENSIFDIHNELLRLSRKMSTENGDGFTPPLLQAVIADIRFRERVDAVVGRYRPDVIFHAAAHKHVPLMEMNPVEAISNNVFGTSNLLEAALHYDVERFVMISTDKAVNPTSIMGASKRAAELLVLNAARKSGKPYGAVRFGNVLGSRGSVVLTFQRQIEEGGPVTVSHPEMNRYFMTIPEAVQLVLQAAVLGEGGDIFVLDMGEPVKIVDLARDLIELSGLEVNRDIDIIFTGIRPGEKLYEELFIPGERYQRTHHEKIMIAANASAFVPQNLDEAFSSFHKAIANQDRLAIIRTLMRLIPEFQPDGEQLAADTPGNEASPTRLPELTRP